VSDTVTIIGLKQVLARLRRLRRVPNEDAKKMMSEIAEFAIFRILDRTSRGVDVNETAFKPYSPRYALFRQKKGLPTNIVDLTVTGMMLSSISYESDTRKARIFFQNITDRSDTPAPMKAYFLNQEREFFAINDEDKERALAIVERYIRRASRGRGRR
jgi:hypothetical protein